jgi:phage terminase large subunit
VTWPRHGKKQGRSVSNELDRFRADVGAIVAKHEAKKGRADFTKYKDNPVGFLRDVLKCSPWEMQCVMAELVRDHARVCIVSANSIGKDWLLSRLFLWWVYARRGMVIATSVTDRQARQITMREVRRAFLATPSLPGELFQMELRVDDSSGILAFTSDHVEKLVGFHHPKLLLALSEGQGLDAQVFEAAFACATGAENKIVLYGNPTVVAGAFHTAATNGNWQTLTIPASAHPNIVTGREEIPGGPSRAWMADLAAEYGITSSIYRARVLSEWPDSAIEGLVTRSMMLAAFARHESGALDDAAFAYRPRGADDPDNPMSQLRAAKLGYAPALSADIARFGPDHSVLAIIRGPKVEALHTWHGKSTVESAEIIAAHAERLWACREVAPPRIVIDDGGVGGGVTDQLRKMKWGVTAYNGSNRAIDPRKHLNRRAEAHWRFRTLLETNAIALPRDEMMLEEALAVEYQLVPSSGAIQIVSKETIRSALGRSPDRLDAIVAGLWATLGSGRQTAWWGTVYT